MVINPTQAPSPQLMPYEPASEDPNGTRMTTSEMMSVDGSGRLVHPRSVGKPTPHALAYTVDAFICDPLYFLPPDFRMSKMYLSTYASDSSDTSPVQ